MRKIMQKYTTLNRKQQMDKICIVHRFYVENLSGENHENKDPLYNREYWKRLQLSLKLKDNHLRFLASSLNFADAPSLSHTHLSMQHFLFYIHIP